MASGGWRSQTLGSSSGTIPGDILAQPVPSDPVLEHFVLEHGTGTWAPTRSFWVSRGSTCQVYKAVNQQKVQSVELRPARALLRLDLFYLKELSEVGLFMYVESRCFELAGAHMNRGELFRVAVAGSS